MTLVLACARVSWKTTMPSISPADIATQKQAAAPVVLLTPKEAAPLLKVSLSLLAKMRMRGDGPPYIKVGRLIRYPESAIAQWMKSRQRLSTSEH
jgi:excisionase family DNA binding protein